MREQGTLTRRALASAIPLAVLAAAPAAALPAIATAGADDVVVDLGRRWQAVLEVEQAHGRLFRSSMSDAEATQHKAIGDELNDATSALFDRIASTPATTLAGSPPRPGCSRMPPTWSGSTRLRSRQPSTPRRISSTGRPSRSRSTSSGSRGLAHERASLVIPFPRSAPVRALCAGGQALAPFTAAWCSTHLPLIDAAMDLLAADDVEFARRCALMRDEDGRAMFDELAGQLQRLRAEVSDVADALGLTAERIRGEMFTLVF